MHRSGAGRFAFPAITRAAFSRAEFSLSAFSMAALSLAALLAGCTSTRETSPARSATEQLLVSTAIDRAVEHLDLAVPTGTKVFVDAEQLEGGDGKYAAAVLKDHLLRRGAHLVADRGKADAVVEIRAGALSIDDKKTLVGTDSFEVPVPFAGQAASIPEIALYRHKQRLGVAKLAATGYRTTDGGLLATTGPQFGYSHVDERLLLFFFSWRSSDLPQEPGSALLGLE